MGQVLGYGVVMSEPTPDPAELNVERLQLLRKVGLSGSIAAAARDCGISASAVSQQISALEREAGVPLVERMSRGVRLTGAGEMLAERARMIAAILEEARAKLDLAGGGVSGKVRVAAVASACAGLVSPALRELADSKALVEVSVQSCEPSESLALLETGRVDLAIIDEYDHVPLAIPEELVSTLLVEDPLVAVVARSNADEDGPTSLARLADQAWIMPPDDAACGRAVRTACRAQGFEPRVVWETDDMFLLTRAVELGHGIAVLPELAVADYGHDVVRLPLRRPALRRRLQLLARKSSASRQSVAAVAAALAAIAKRRS